MDTPESLIGSVFGELKVKDVVGEEHLLCECTCGEVTIVEINNLINFQIKSCGHVVNEPKNITGKHFGKWYVHSYVGKRQWNVICECGKKDIKDGGKLRYGSTRSCKQCAKLVDLKGKTFGELKVIEYVGKRKWKCECSCGEIIHVVGADLKSGHTKSCGHNTTKFKDIKGQKFGLLTVKEYLGNQIWRCECSCENKTIVDVDGRRLRFGTTKSCGCASRNFAKQTMLNRYGEVCSLKINEPREDWQIEAIKSKENLEKVLDTLGDKPTTSELCEILGLGLSEALKVVHKYNLEDRVFICMSNKSGYEEDIAKFIHKVNSSIDIVRNDKRILNRKELDIYIPSKNIAIEFNGNYWHSDLYVDKKFHQQKTIDCYNKGIRLIHIFESEWNNDSKQAILKGIIKNIVQEHDTRKRVYGRQVKIKEVDSTDIHEFLNRNHLQGAINSTINLVATLENLTVASLSFSKPRFSNQYEYEITRLCYNQDIVGVGVTEKLFKYFIDKYKPKSIVSYCDASKFDGAVYRRLGFTEEPDLTEPSYIWIRTSGEVVSRYQAQKHRLVESGVAKPGETEDSIMRRLGYLKVFDSGNRKFTWYDSKSTEI